MKRLVLSCRATDDDDDDQPGITDDDDDDDDDDQPGINSREESRCEL